MTTETKRGSNGGTARAEKLTKEQRSAIAREAAQKRWGRTKETSLIDPEVTKAIDGIAVGIKKFVDDQIIVANSTEIMPIENLVQLTNTGSEYVKPYTVAVEKPVITLSPQASPDIPKPAPKRKKPMAKEFGKAHSYAEKRLTEAIKERHELNGRLAAINAEIPSLVQIIRALGGTVDPQFNQIPSYPMQNGNPYQFPAPAYTAPMTPPMAPQAAQMPSDGIDPALYATNAPTAGGLPPVPKVPLIPNTAMGGGMDLDYVPTPDDEGPGLPRMGGGWQ